MKRARIKGNQSFIQVFVYEENEEVHDTQIHRYRRKRKKRKRKVLT